MERFTSTTLLLPWAIIIALSQVLNPLGIEIAILTSGFLALFSALLLFLILLLFEGDRSVLLRKTLAALLIISPPAIFIPFPWGALLLFLAGAGLLAYFFPSWQLLQDETVRIEPIFFLIVGLKIAFVLLFLLQ